MYSNGEFPDQYYAQCMHYLAVTGCEKIYLAVLCFPHFYTFELKRDEDEIEALVKAEAEFWQHVQDKTPVNVDDSDNTTETINGLYPKDNNQIINLTDVHPSSLDEYFEISNTIKELEKNKAFIENEIKSVLQDNQVGLINDYKVEWKTYSRSSLDSKRLKEEQPSIYDLYTKQSEYRRFTIKKNKAKEIKA